jgi:hypothetical protein
MGEGPLFGNDFRTSNARSSPGIAYWPELPVLTDIVEKLGAGEQPAGPDRRGSWYFSAARRDRLCFRVGIGV